MILLFVSMVFVNCVEKKEMPIVKMEIKTKKMSNQTIEVEVETNFPENTLFTVSASRDYKRKQNSERYSGELYYSYNSKVKDGLIHFTFKTDDQKWIKEYKELQKKYKKNDKSLTDIYSIKDTIEINILFTPKVKQSKNVEKFIGENGEKLKGDDVEDNGDFKTFSRTVKIYDKYN